MRRRTFLRGAGGIAVALPFLESTSARGAAGPGSPRFVTMLHGNGTLRDSWTPAQTGTNFELSEILTPLEPVKDKINILSGIDNGITGILGSGHGISSRTLLTARPAVEHIQPDQSLANAYGEPLIASGPSIDQSIASLIGTETRFRSVDLASGGGTGSGTLFVGEADPVTLEPNPQAAFDRLFADFKADPSMPTTMDMIRERRASVLDAVGESFTDLNNRVSASDRHRLEAHLEKIRQLEQQVGSLSLECEPPTIATPEGYDFNSASYDNITAPLMIDIAAMALACGLTNVASLTFTNGHTPTFPWLGEDIPGEFSHWHDMVHLAAGSATGRPALAASFRWFAEVFELFVSRLDAYDEGDATLLDNTVMLWLTQFGDGGAHSSRSLPIVLAGGACGALETGRHLAFDDHTVGDLCTSFLRLFGDEETLFGWPGTVTGPLPGL